MKLFTLRDWNLEISEEAYAITVFKNIVDADKGKDKEVAMKELAFIYFMADTKSDYEYILNKHEREIEIKKDVGLPTTWKKSKLIDNAIEYYKDHSKTVSSVILQNSLYIANTISNMLRKATEVEELSIAEIEKVAKGLSQMPNIVSSLQKLEQTVLKEQSEKSDRVGSQDKAMFEDGL
jgi:hypothetical protein